LVIETLESSIRDLRTFRESLKKAELILHSDLANYVRSTLGKKVNATLTGSGWADVLVSATTTGMLLLGRANPSDPNLKLLAKGASKMIEEDETIERQVAKVARARKSEIDELSTTELLQLLERLTIEPIQDILNSDWSKVSKSFPGSRDLRS